MKNIKSLIKFKGRNPSASYDLNYLANNNNIYAMDNHKMALWCWMQVIEDDKKYKLIHIDRHTDCQTSKIEMWMECIQSVEQLRKMSITEYDELKSNVHDENSKVFNWGNYISIFMELFRDRVTEIQMITNNQGERINDDKVIEELSPWNLLTYFDRIFDVDDEKIILNIDLDYFVSVIDESKNIYVNTLGDEYREYFIDKIVEEYSRNKIAVITFALSPECSGGWDNSLMILNSFLGKFKLKTEEI